MFTLSCKIDAFAKYLNRIRISMVVNNDNNSNIENNERASCPYCSSKFNDNEVLSKHIDRIHHGSGLLEGDSRRW